MYVHQIIWFQSIVSNKPQKKYTEQQHQEQVLNALLKQVKKNKKKSMKQKKDSWKCRDFYILKISVLHTTRCWQAEL